MAYTLCKMVVKNIKNPERAKSTQTDRETDRMVYDFHGLTDEEMKIVEESVW